MPVKKAVAGKGKRVKKTVSSNIRVCGKIMSVIGYATRKSGLCVKVELELEKGQPLVGVWVFPDLYEKCTEILKKGRMVTVEGRYRGVEEIGESSAVMVQLIAEKMSIANK